MNFFKKTFPKDRFTIVPIGDVHVGSPQSNIKLVEHAVSIIEEEDDTYAVLMGDLIENAIVGSKSDVYTQIMPPKEQIEWIVDVLTPIKDKILFTIAGNHEQRSTRLVGLHPEQIIADRLWIPYKGFSCGCVFLTNSSNTPKGFSCFFHHNYGGGYTKGGKVNRAVKLRDIVPGADATFSGHFHTTSRIPTTWFETGRKKMIAHTGYDYITGSALEYADSYADERAKSPATAEFIKVTFIGCSNGQRDNRKQEYSIIKL